jgi:hypothetical protein
MVSMVGETAELLGGAHGRHPAHPWRGERGRRHAVQTAPLGGCQCKRVAWVFGDRRDAGGLCGSGWKCPARPPYSWSRDLFASGCLS